MVKVNVIQVQTPPEGDAGDGSCRLPRRHSRRLASTRGLAPDNEHVRRRQQETLPAVESTRHVSDSFLQKLRFFERDADACEARVAETTPRQGEPDGDEDSGVVEEEEIRPQKRRSAVALGVGCGWVRVFSGEDERGALVYLTLDTTASDVCRDLLLQEDDAIWVQYGGGASRRLRATEAPLGLQDALLRGLGYGDATRRARLGIDPELRHLLRFSVGPSMPRPGLVLGGPLCVLKGLVFPQWRRRNVAIVAGRMLIFPATDGPPEEVVLSGGDVNERTPKAGRLVLRVTEYLDGLQPRHVFLGFLRPSDRDIWYSWLTKASHEPAVASRLDLSGGGLERLPDVSLLGSTVSGVRELWLSRNRLRDLGPLAQLRGLTSLALAENELAVVPDALLQLSALERLDLSGNSLSDLPTEMHRLQNLQELRLDRNSLRCLPSSLGRLQALRSLWVTYNLLCELPTCVADMRALTLLDLQGNRLQEACSRQQDRYQLGRLVLRDNLLKGNIVLANYGNLTQLDVSENSIESLDLSALNKLENVQCSRNKLVELTLNGKSLTSLIAGNNSLTKLTISPPPLHLKHLDVSYNELELLPNWVAGCSQLRALFASHNKLHSLPDHMFCSDLISLQTLQLSYNQLVSLPAIIHHANLQELFLQSNSIAMLPSNFFTSFSRLRVLNLSNNRLCELPGDFKLIENQVYQLEKLYLTANCLTDSSLDVIAKFTNLRILHAAYNCLTSLPQSCIAAWKDLEELLLSGNKLQHLPDNITFLEHLRVLRVHSNRLQTSPCFAKMTSLKVLDLAHNQLDRINLATLVPQQLQFLDLSCNSRLYVDPRQFQVYRNKRPMSLVDVSGHNRTCLPSTPYNEGNGELEPPWKIGFSEAAGQREKLYISQIRLPAFCNTEGLFGMFDGGNNNDLPNVLIKAVPRILLEERTVKETASEYMKYTMLSAHRELKEKGQKYGVCATLCHISKVRNNINQAINGFTPKSPRYIMRVASVGDAKAVLCRQSEGIVLTKKEKSTICPKAVKPRSQLGCSSMFPLVIPDPHVMEILLEDNDEFLIMANKRFWEVVSVSEAVEEVRQVSNAILAAKKLQDLAQSYGCEENLSIIVVRFYNLGSDVDQLMRELRHTIRKTQHQHMSSDESKDIPTQFHNCCHNSSFQDGLVQCCCRNGSIDGSECGLENGVPEVDRSSPSGQSDHAGSDYASKTLKLSSKNILIHHPPQHQSATNKTTPYTKSKFVNSSQHQSVLMHENGTKKMSAMGPALERRSYRESKRSSGGVLKAIRAKLDNYSNGNLADAEEEETASDRSGTQMSEEQFKCWEYMLEQNTQLLFDKELDTLSRGFMRQASARPAVLEPLQPHSKVLSRSSPHLADGPASPGGPFLSKHFGSARSFNPVSRNLRFGSGRQPLNGGPNAAYFGSLQRLMPYNLEYNFSVIQERGTNQDSIEYDNRMHQYWDVATTEL